MIGIRCCIPRLPDGDGQRLCQGKAWRELRIRLLDGRNEWSSLGEGFFSFGGRFHDGISSFRGESLSFRTFSYGSCPYLERFLSSFARFHGYVERFRC
jgi:hypothetical protein